MYVGYYLDNIWHNSWNIGSTGYFDNEIVPSSVLSSSDMSLADWNRYQAFGYFTGSLATDFYGGYWAAQHGCSVSQTSSGYLGTNVQPPSLVGVTGDKIMPGAPFMNAGENFFGDVYVKFGPYSPQYAVDSYTPQDFNAWGSNICHVQIAT